MQPNSILEDIKNVFRQQNNAVVQIILINLFVFIGINIVRLFFFLFNYSFDEMIMWLSVPASLTTLLYRPWTIFTYMFLHEGFFHILFNMLWLYWIGQILREYIGNQKIYPIYILGGLAGALLYIVSYNVFPVFANVLEISFALGASAGVLAIVIAAATLLPDYTIHLLFFGGVRLKYLAIFALLFDLISIPKGNAGGHIAHLGGALLGFVFIKQLQSGNDWSKPINNLFDFIQSWFNSETRPKVVFRNENKSKQSSTKVNQKKIDEILDKIAQSGYDNLTQEEKEFLFRASKENE